jgi:hypothetical protein
LKEDEDVLILSRETVRKSEGKERERTCGPTPSRYLKEENQNYFFYSRKNWILKLGPSMDHNNYV